MNDSRSVATLSHELAKLTELRDSEVRRARHPATDPRIALESEAEAAALNLKIADLAAKLEDAETVNLPKRRRRS